MIIATGGADPFRATGASLGLDWTPVPRVAWRTEAKGFTGRKAVFVDRDGPGGRSTRNAVVVTSLGLAF